MYAQDHNTTADSDIVVELAGVHKTFRQKQRSERPVSYTHLTLPTILRV